MATSSTKKKTSSQSNEYLSVIRDAASSLGYNDSLMRKVYVNVNYIPTCLRKQLFEFRRDNSLYTMLPDPFSRAFWGLVHETMP